MSFCRPCEKSSSYERPRARRDREGERRTESEKGTGKRWAAEPKAAARCPRHTYMSDCATRFEVLTPEVWSSQIKVNKMYAAQVCLFMSRENQNRWEVNTWKQKVVAINWPNPTQGTAAEVDLDLGHTFYFPGCLQSKGHQESKCKSICCQPSVPFSGAIWKL